MENEQTEMQLTKNEQVEEEKITEGEIKKEEKTITDLVAIMDEVIKVETIESEIKDEKNNTLTKKKMKEKQQNVGINKNLFKMMKKIKNKEKKSYKRIVEEALTEYLKQKGV